MSSVHLIIYSWRLLGKHLMNCVTKPIDTDLWTILLLAMSPECIPPKG